MKKEECNVECFIVAFPLLRLSEIRVSGKGQGKREQTRERTVARGGMEGASERNRESERERTEKRNVKCMKLFPRVL